MKYGFIYIWFDRKRKMFYIGSHWGAEDDGYICSSTRMRNAFRRRPKDFGKRKIISRIYTNRLDLLDKEYKWLSLIKDEELGKKYYNLRKWHAGHWSTDENKYNNIKEKLSNIQKTKCADPEFRKLIAEKTKEAMARPEVRKKYLDGLKNRNKIPWNKGKKGAQIAWNKGLTKDDERIKQMNIKRIQTIKDNGSMKSLKWYFNPGSMITGRFEKEKQPEGYVLGRGN